MVDEDRQRVRLLYLFALLDGDHRRASGIWQTVTVLDPDLLPELERLDAERSILRPDVPPFTTP